jgi:Leucine Rich repeats (2 copies)
MKITVRFEKTEPSFKETAASFLKSLGLDPDHWLEDQELEYESGKEAEIFGVHTSLPEDLSASSEWIARIHWADGSLPMNGFALFEINKIPLGAEVAEGSKADQVIEQIPPWIRVLSFAENGQLTRAPESLNRFVQLVGINFRQCGSLSDLGPLTGLNSLVTLILNSCESLSNLAPLKTLHSLRMLSLINCSSLNDLQGIDGLSSLSNLNLSWCKSLSDLGPLKDLLLLRKLDLNCCDLLSDLRPLASLHSLVSLRLSTCRLIQDLTPLAGLSSLEELDLRCCEGVTNLAPLAGLIALRILYVSWCKSLTNLAPLSGLNALRELHLRCCTSLEDIEALSGLTSLKTLDLGGADQIRDISALKKVPSLEKVNFTSRRIKSIEGLREIPSLRELKEFDPPQVAECLARTAYLRWDVSSIADHAEEWLGEASAWEEGTLSMRDRFAATLGEAFSLLGDHPIVNPYEEFLRAHPEFSSAPWRAWLDGIRKKGGEDNMRLRIDAQGIANSSLGCLGGICLVLPEEEWSRQWLAELEKDRSGNAKELLPVAPEICLAYARLSEMEALGRWLERLTDPSDPGALDELQVSFAKWRLTSGDLQNSRRHISAIHSPTARDPILAELVLAELAADPDTASEDLLLVQGTETRGELAKKLASEPTFTSSESRLHRLLVAAGENPTALAELITLLGASVPSEIVNRLSAQLGMPKDELEQWRISLMDSVLVEMKSKRRLSN